MLGGEVAQTSDTADEPVPDQSEGLPVEDQIRVVSDEGARGPQVNDATSCGCRVPKEVNVRHDIMAESLFVLGGLGEVDVVEAAPHLVDGIVADGESQLLFRLGQGQPQSPPCPISIGWGEHGLHLPGGVAFSEGMAVAVVGVVSHGFAGKRAVSR